MTGKRSLGRKRAVWMHDLGFVLRKNIWIFPLGLVIFMLLIPFSTAGLPGNSIFNIEVTHDQMKFRLFLEQAIPAVAAAAAGMGTISGISLFGFVRDKRESTIFFSLGITRMQLYRNRILCGTLMLAGITGIPMALSVWLNVRALGAYQCLIRNAVYLWLGICVIALFSFCMTAAVSFLSGTLSEALVYWAGIMSAPAVLCIGANLLLKKLYWGSAWGVAAYTGGGEIRSSLLEQYAFLNPFLFFTEEMRKHAQFIRPLRTDVPEPVSYGLLAGWAAAVILLSVAAGFLLKYRKAENAGLSGTHLILSELVIALTGFLAFSLAFTYLYEYSVVLAAVMGFFGFCAVHLFWRKLLFVCETRFLKTAVSVSGQTIILVLACVIFQSGFFHRDVKYLEEGKPVQASVSYVGAPCFLGEEASGSTSGRGYYLLSRITVEKPEAIEKVKELQQIFLESGKRKMESGKKVSETVVPYDICFSYTDSDGRERLSYYDRASYEQLEQLLSLEEEGEVLEKQTQMFLGEKESTGKVWNEQAYRNGEIFLTDTYFTGTYQLTLSGERREQFLHAVAQDLENMDIQQKYFPDGKAEAVLMFTGNGEEDCKYYSYHLNNAFLYLTEDYVHTLSWLEENQLLSLLPREPEIEHIYLQELDPYVGINPPSYPMGMYFMSYCADTADEFMIQKDFGKKNMVKDSEEIQETAAGLQNGYFMSRGGYLAAVKVKGQEKYRYFFLPADRVPDFVR